MCMFPGSKGKGSAASRFAPGTIQPSPCPAAAEDTASLHHGEPRCELMQYQAFKLYGIDQQVH